MESNGNSPSNEITKSNTLPEADTSLSRSNVHVSGVEYNYDDSLLMADINQSSELLIAATNVERTVLLERCEPNEPILKESSSEENAAAKRKLTHKQRQSSVGQAIDTGKKMLEDSAKSAFKFCCFVIFTGKQLITYKDLPKWLQDNDFIKHFHRPQLKSFKLCFKSVFSLHTETGNIWTHIIGVLIMLTLGFIILLRPVINKDGYPNYPKGVQEYLFFTIFFISAGVCMTFSWLFHTMSCHSEKVHSIFAKMDYMGISLLITGSSIPVLYFGFYCEMKLFYIYLGIILGMCFCSIVVSLWHVFASPNLRPLRATVFLVFGLSNIIPIIHVGVRYGFVYTRDAIAVYYLVSMGTLYVTGALLYTFRVPERFFPEKITLVFQSHQIFHVLIVVAAVVHAFAICNMAQYRVQCGNDCALLSLNQP